MKKIFNFLFFSYQRKKLFIQTLFLVGLIRIGLWTVPYRKLVEWLNYLSSADAISQEVDWGIIKEVAYAVKICSRNIPYASCLTQALALRTLLRKRGQDAELKFGVLIDPDRKFSAHAWLEKEGKIIIGRLVNHENYSDLKHNSYVVL